MNSAPRPQPQCPMCGNKDARPFDRLDLETLEGLYRTRWGVELGVLSGVAEGGIDLLECLACGLQFHFPLVSGDGGFYAELSKHPSYYPNSRWEFSKVAEWIPPGGLVLDVGAGDGRFLSTLSPGGHVGVELNPRAAELGRERGLDIRTIGLEDLVGGPFDCVTMFQVLEHLDRPTDLLRAAFERVSSGGVLVVSVPNNDAFIGDLPYEPLNCVPHHPLRWGRRSLESVGGYLGAESCDVLEEPLQAEHVFQFRKVGLLRILPRRFLRRMPGGGFSRLLDRCVNLLTRATLIVAPVSRGKRQGHTVLAVFRKR